MLMSWFGFVGIILGVVLGIIVDCFKNFKSIFIIVYFIMVVFVIWQFFWFFYQVMFIIVGFMFLVGNGLFLVFMIKIVRFFVLDNEQGWYFGFLEFGCGIVGIVLMLCVVVIVGLYGFSVVSIGFIL